MNENNDGLSWDEFSRLIWDNRNRIEADLSNDKKSIMLWLDDKGYKSHAIFECLFYVAAKKASKSDDGTDTPPKEAILMFCQIKSSILSLITAVNNMAIEYSLDKQEYSDILLKIDAFTNWAIFELDTQLKDSQIKTNEIANETNRISKSTNRFIAMFTGIAGLWYLHDLLNKVIPDSDDYNKELIVMPITVVVICLLMNIIRQKGRKELSISNRKQLANP